MDALALSDRDQVEALPGVYLAQLAAGAEMSIQHFHVEPGAEVPEHDHPHEQAGFIYQGALTFFLDGEEIVCETGDSYVIPGEEPHGAENRGDEAVMGVDIFSPPRTNPDWAQD